MWHTSMKEADHFHSQIKLNEHMETNLEVNVAAWGAAKKH